MQVVVLAAGLGTRLRPVTNDRSKAMVPVLGRPLVEHALDGFVSNGLRDVVAVVGPDDVEIRRRMTEQAPVGLRVRFAVQERRLGMGHALAAAACYLDGDFALTACDSLVSAAHVAEMLEARVEGGAVLSLLDVEPELVCRSAAVELDGNRVRRIVEKPAPGRQPSDTVSLPHYLLPQRLLPLLADLETSPRGEIELQSAIQRLIDDGADVVGVRAGKRTQVSDPEDLRTLNLAGLAAGEGVAVEPGAVLGSGTVIRQPVRVEDGVTIGGECEIGPGVYLEAGCRIGSSATVRRSVVLRTAVVPEGSIVDGEVLV